MSVVAELRRRNVFRVAAAYLVVGWLLTEVLTTILPTIGAPEWMSRAVILTFALGFLPAVILSWFFEITPDGVKRDHEVDRADPALATRARRIDQLTIGAAIALIIVVGLFSARYTADDPTAVDLGVSTASVAVLPFVNMSNDKDNEYFSDGLTETLLHMLAQVPDLKVAARTSSFAFKGQNVQIQEIARALQVAHILEGSVQRVGDRVRITAQLIRASDGFHVWSETYDRTLDDIFAIQDEIAHRVGSALSASLLPGGEDAQPEGVHTANADAYDLYLQARKERATYSYGGLKTAEDLLKGALLIDPDFLDAKTELAVGYFNQLETGLMEKGAAFAEIQALTAQVLEVRPQDPVARAAAILATLLPQAVGGNPSVIRGGIAELEGIVTEAPQELQPRIFLIRAYSSVQRFDEAIPLLQEALRLDPYNPVIHYELGGAYARLKRWDEARRAMERSLALEPAQPNAYTTLGAIAMQDGDAVGFVTQFVKSLAVDPRDPELPGILAGFLYELGLVSEADDFRKRVLTLAPNSEIAHRIELLRAVAMGDRQAAIASARRAITDDVQERHGSFTGAVQYLLGTAVQDGTVTEELAWLEEQMPGALDVDAEHVPQKSRLLQGIALSAWFAALPREEMLRRLDVLIKGGSELGIDPEQNPDTWIAILALRGEIDTAIDVALERVFSQSVATRLGWRDVFAQPQYAEIVADPRIQDAMRRWEAEESRLRNSVQAYFNDLQAAS